jgi:hypothetical protein
MTTGAELAIIYLDCMLPWLAAQAAAAKAMRPLARFERVESVSVIPLRRFDPGAIEEASNYRAVSIVTHTPTVCFR